METKIDVADLIKPKFQPRQTVYLVEKDSSNTVTLIKQVLIERVRFEVTFYMEKGGKQCRTTKLIYELTNSRETYEEALFANLSDITKATT